MEASTAEDIQDVPEELICVLQMLLDRKLKDIPPQLRTQLPSIKAILEYSVDNQFPYDRYAFHITRFLLSTQFIPRLIARSAAHVERATTFVGVLELRGEAVQNLRDLIPKHEWSHNALLAYFVSNCDGQYCFIAYYRQTRLRLERAVRAIVTGKATKLQKLYLRACAEAEPASILDKGSTQPELEPTYYRERFIYEFFRAHRDYEVYMFHDGTTLDKQVRAETGLMRGKMETFTL
ncbi:hypothetical protein K491DRAFT_475417 [Lophiostoma macrostomum CBS 122681]|uniref:Uncharacterized protein n=1 Tax=Lophiostoma macrostomum CBS 122681 TaxID=1314788 RepID=A0A6A6T5V9_9PLEO|nr:hypothetical protein K491DRAFT_475417 [Lophiostoma macrostomum CBS 122681]